MPATYELITSYTVPSNVGTVTLSSIPATYTDLVIVGNFSVANGGGVGFSCRFNGDSGSNYEFMGSYANGSSVQPNYAQPYTITYLAIALNTNPTTLVAHVLNYATTGRYRTVLAHAGNEGFNSSYTGNWNNSTDAINSITFICDGGSNINAGSKFFLYGILKG